MKFLCYDVRVPQKTSFVFVKKNFMMESWRRVCFSPVSPLVVVILVLLLLFCMPGALSCPKVCA